VELLETLQKAAELDLGDFFRYTVAAARPPELVGPPEGGLRFRVEAHLDRTQPFATFVLDVGMGDVRINPTEYLDASVDLSFAELPPVRFPVIPLLEHFAEKLHAYTRPRTARTRVKDLVDLLLLIEVLAVKPSPQLKETLEAVFGRYQTHALPRAATLEPPEGWREPFAALVAELDLGAMDIELAHHKLVGLLDQM
jgi:hypothetical protein